MNKLSKIVLAATGIVAASSAKAAEKVWIEPSGTYLYASKDGQDLYMDVYEPAEGSVTSIDGREKPAVIFMFGGGFKEGERNNLSYSKWFSMLSENGFKVISIDYRLGLAGVKKVGLTQAGLVENAIHLAVEDLFSATSYIVQNAEMLGVNPSNIVISGSSAGAISVMQAEWELCNATSYASLLPEGFRYAGVMSFAGAIFSRKGRIRYAEAPSPILMFHGTADKVVEYKQIWFFRLRFAGSCVIARTLARCGFSYNFYRFKDCSHEIAVSMEQNFAEEMRFIETNVMKGSPRIIDALVTKDPAIPESVWKGMSSADLYKD